MATKQNDETQSISTSTEGIKFDNLSDKQESKSNLIIGSKNIVCPDCPMGVKYCEGHYGQINLSTPPSSYQHAKNIQMCRFIKANVCMTCCKWIGPSPNKCNNKNH